MRCDHAVERMPWLLNQTLEADERRSIEEHVDGCESCRTELASTREAGVLYATHVPTSALVGRVLGGGEGPLPDEIVDRHLDRCETCAAELELVLESARTAEAEPTVVPVPRSPEPWRWTALAASLVALVSIAGWAVTGLAPTSPSVTAGVAVVDLQPLQETTRGRATAAEVVEGRALLFLNAQPGVAGDVERMELVLSDGRRLDLPAEPLAGGTFTLDVDAATLPAGETSVLLYGTSSEVLQTFEFEIE